MYKTLKYLSVLIPVKRWRKSFRDCMINKHQLKLYKKQTKILKQKISNNKKIDVAFFVIFDSVFSAKIIFEKLINDEIFNPFILVIPDTSRGQENMFYQMNKTYKTLSGKYKNVYTAYDYEKSEFTDWSDKIDIAFFANPYDNMTDKLYTIDYARKKNILPVYTSYGIMCDLYSIDHVINLKSMNLCWKIFADTQFNLDDFCRYTSMKGKNAILTGYAKMDELANIPVKKRNRKKVIIAPHHTVSMTNLPLSNFLKYSEFFLELPRKYPNIDFVFRPHPLLFVTLAKEDLWGKEKTQNYLEKIKSYNNVEYQDGGEYLETFVNSDGIIHDCVSFLVEYLYVNKPSCYMLKNKSQIEKIFTPLGQKCLEHYYQAFNQEDIINFIENNILTEKISITTEREKFINENLKINYPNVSNIIIKNLKDELK